MSHNEIFSSLTGFPNDLLFEHQYLIRTIFVEGFYSIRIQITFCVFLKKNCKKTLKRIFLFIKTDTRKKVTDIICIKKKNVK